MSLEKCNRWKPIAKHLDAEHCPRVNIESWYSLFIRKRVKQVPVKHKDINKDNLIQMPLDLSHQKE